MPSIVVASYAQSVWPGVREWFGVAYNRFPLQWAEIFDQYTSDKQFEREVMHHGVTTLRAKPETQAIEYDFMQQIRAIEYRHTTYGLGLSISREHLEDNLYPDLVQQRAEELGLKARMTQEVVAALWVSRLFTAGASAYADGKAVCATDHPLARGGTFANRPTNGVDLSEASLEQALIDIQQYPDETGNKANIQGMKLIIPVSLQFEACRILDNPDRPATADRDINSMYRMGKLPQGYVVNNYIDDQDMWMIKTDCMNGMKHFQRRPVEISNDTSDFDTENMRMKVTYRDSFGISDLRGIYASPGA